jgi:hypothetical protein
MPKGPNGEKRPGDVIGAAIMVAKIATGEVADDQASNSHERAKAAAKGGEARARKLTSEERSKIAASGARSRWKKDLVAPAKKEPT